MYPSLSTSLSHQFCTQLMWLIRITGKYTCETMYPHHFLHQSGYILGTHDFGFYYYFTNIGGVFLIYLHWKHGLSYTFEIQWMLDSLTGGIFRGLCGGVSPLARATFCSVHHRSSRFYPMMQSIIYPGIDFKNKK